MPTPLPESRMSSSVFSAWTLAACSPRSTGMEPTGSKKDFMALPLMPPVVKYSAFAKKATGRGIRAWTITLSRNERWFGATMNGPSLGTFSRPMTVGRHVVVTSPRVVQRIASNIAIGVHLVQGCGPRAFGESVDRRVKRRGGVHDLDGTGRVQFAVGRKPPAYADAVQSVRSGPGDVLRPVPHHHGPACGRRVRGSEVRERGGDDAGLASGGRAVGNRACGNGTVGHRARSRAGGLVGGGAPGTACSALFLWMRSAPGRCGWRLPAVRPERRRFPSGNG